MRPILLFSGGVDVREGRGGADSHLCILQRRNFRFPQRLNYLSPFVSLFAARELAECIRVAGMKILELSM